VFSAHATAMRLCLFDEKNEPITELDMHKADHIWHVEAVDCPKVGVLYGVRVFGEGGWDVGHRWDPKRVVLDPYTPLVSGRRQFGIRDEIERYVRGVWTAASRML
jgi:isoamylase